MKVWEPRNKNVEKNTTILITQINNIDCTHIDTILAICTTEAAQSAPWPFVDLKPMKSSTYINMNKIDSSYL